MRKGGRLEDTVGRKCVCNGLLGNLGLGQVRPDGDVEKPFVTSGDVVAEIASFLKPGADSYSAADVIENLLSKVTVLAGRETRQREMA